MGVSWDQNFVYYVEDLGTDKYSHIVSVGRTIDIKINRGHIHRLDGLNTTDKINDKNTDNTLLVWFDSQGNTNDRPGVNGSILKFTLLDKSDAKQLELWQYAKGFNAKSSLANGGYLELGYYRKFVSTDPKVGRYMQIGSKESTLGLYFGASSRAIIAYVPEKVIGYLAVNTESIESVIIKSQSLPKFITSGKSIKSVSIKSNIDTINQGVLSHSTAEKIELPDSVRTLGEKALLNCINLKTLTANGVRNIGKLALSGCESLEVIEIPENTDTLSDSAFRDCTLLRKLILNDGSYTFDIEAVKGCDNLDEIILLGTKGLTVIIKTYDDNIKFKRCIIKMGVEQFIKCLSDNTKTITVHGNMIPDGLYLMITDLEGNQIAIYNKYELRFLMELDRDLAFRINRDSNINFDSGILKTIDGSIIKLSDYIFDGVRVPWNINYIRNQIDCYDTYIQTGKETQDNGINTIIESIINRAIEITQFLRTVIELNV